MNMAFKFIRIVSARLLLALVWTISSSPLYSMEFNFETLRDGTQALRASGPIVSGDDANLQQWLETVPAEHFGHMMLLLNSPGGDVAEALRMADTIAEMGVITVVSWQNECASACTLMFVSGQYRFLLGDGRLWLHSCQVAQGSVSLCNQDLSDFFASRGFPFSSVLDMFQRSAEEKNQFTIAQHQDCFSFVHPPWLGPDDLRGTCERYLSSGKMEASRDWEPSLGYTLPSEQLSHMSEYRAVQAWSPPNVWSFGLERDGMTIQYRRFGQLPLGAEVELGCYFPRREQTMVYIRGAGLAKTYADTVLRVTAGQLFVETPVVHARERWLLERAEHIHFEAIAFLPERFRHHLATEDVRSISFEILDHETDAVRLRIDGDWRSARGKFNLLPHFCAGRFIDSP